MSLLYFKLLLVGAGVTVLISAISVAIGLSLGVAVCAATLAPGWPWRRLGGAYVSFFRGVPMLVQLLLIYHVLPQIGLNVPGWAAAITGMSLCTAAYQAENLRGGFLNVPLGMVEAAQMLGMRPRQILLRIRLPIALRLTLPAVLNEAIMILKASSLVSVVGVADVTRVAQNLSASTFEPIPMYATAGALYLAMNLALIGLGGRLRHRLRQASA